MFLYKNILLLEVWTLSLSLFLNMLSMPWREVFLYTFTLKINNIPEINIQLKSSNFVLIENNSTLYIIYDTLLFFFLPKKNNWLPNSLKFKKIIEKHLSVNQKTTTTTAYKVSNLKNWKRKQTKKLVRSSSSFDKGYSFFLLQMMSQSKNNDSYMHIYKWH